MAVDRARPHGRESRLHQRHAALRTLARFVHDDVGVLLHRADVRDRRNLVGQLPSCASLIWPWTGHVHTDASRACTSVMPHFGHLPGLSMTTSASCSIGQTYEIGGISSDAFGLPVCMRATVDNTSAHARSAAILRIKYVIHPA